MSTHHKWSPSKWCAYTHCLDYTSDDTTSPAAERGILQHSAVEAFLTGTEDDKLDAAALLTPTELENVDFVVEFAKSILWVDGAEVMTEEKILTMGDGMVVVTGTADIIIKRNDFMTNEPEYILIDAKFGKERDYEAQMEVYALGIMQRFNINKITAYAAYGAMKMTSKYYFVRKLSSVFFNDMIGKLKDHENGAITQRNVNDFCEFCSNSKNCPARNGEVLKARDLVKEDVPDSFKLSTNLGDMNIDDLANLYTFIKGVESYGDGVKKLLTKRLEDGEDATLFKITERTGTLKILDDKGFKDKLLDVSEMSHEDIYNELSVSLSDARKVCYGEDYNKKASKDDFEEKFSAYIRRAEPTRMLKKRSKTEIKKLTSNKE